MNDEDEYDDEEYDEECPGCPGCEPEDEETVLNPVRLGWQIPVGSVLEAVSEILTSLGTLSLNLARWVLADHVYRAERQRMADQAHVEIEMLTEES